MSMQRFYCPAPLTPGAEIDLPPGAMRHAQVLRMQAGDAITLFDGGLGTGGLGGEFDASVLCIRRDRVRVRVGVWHAIEREAQRVVHLLAGLCASERMDWLVEKATELGAASITPLLAARSQGRLRGDRADKKIAHWQAIAVAACEQCGRNRVALLHPAIDLADWLEAQRSPPEAARWLLTLRPEASPLHAALATQAPLLLLSGPEGGLDSAEEDLALAHGFAALTLGPRVLRAETAPLAALAALTLGPR